MWYQYREDDVQGYTKTIRSGLKPTAGGQHGARAIADPAGAPSLR
jgi:hypothetical protein